MSASPGPEKERAQACIQDLRPLCPAQPSGRASPQDRTQPSCDEGSLWSGLAAVSGRHPASSQGALESCSAPRLTLIESVLAPAGGSGPAHR